MAAAAAHDKDQDLVGSFMKVTLVTGDVIEGTVFTFHAEQGILMLMQNPRSSAPSLRMIRVPFIRDYTLDQDTKKLGDQRLPPALERYETLPTLVASKANNLEKQCNAACKAAQNKRHSRLNGITASTPIAAVDTFCRLEKVFGTAQWDATRGVIVINDVYVGPDAEEQWEKPVVHAPDGGASGMDERLRTLLAKK